METPEGTGTSGLGPFFIPEAKKYMRVKIVQKGWAGFTGSMGTARFVDGIAELSMTEALRLGANIKLMHIDEDGNDVEIVSHSAEIVRTKHLSAPMLPQRRRGVPDQPKKPKLKFGVVSVESIPAGSVLAEKLTPEQVSAVKDIMAPPADAAPTPAAPKTYTRAQLEQIADEHGIKGLREISDPLEIKNTSIVGLIDAIIAWQEQNAAEE